MITCLRCRCLRPRVVRIRPLVPDDLESCHELYTDIGWAARDISNARNRERRRSWVDWSVRNYEELARLNQPPYGDRAIVRREGGDFIGLVGLVPSFGPFGQLPSFGGAQGARFSPEVGLFWAMAPKWQRQGYASEAARAVVNYAFGTLNLGRIFATTEYDNVASMGVMRRLGMRIDKNPYSDPPWFQVVGTLEYQPALV